MSSHEVNGVALCVSDTHVGDPAVVFLHYFAASSCAWDGVIRLLRHRYRCIAPDLRGFGDSSAPLLGYAVADYAADVRALLTVVNAGRYVLVGHSMGGKFAMALAAQRPPGLAALLLVDPSPPTPEPMSESERKHLLASHGDRAAMQTMIRKAAVYPLPPAVFEAAVDDNLRSSPAAWDAWLTSGSREDIRAMMDGIDVPTLVLRGENDPIMSHELLQCEVGDRIRGSQMIEVRGAGHLLPLEAPVKTAAILARWTAALPAAPLG